MHFLETKSYFFVKNKHTSPSLIVLNKFYSMGLTKGFSGPDLPSGRPCERCPVSCFMFCEIRNMASFNSFECIKIITLELNFYNRKIIVLTQILIEYPIMITECKA